MEAVEVERAVRVITMGGGEEGEGEAGGGDEGAVLESR